MPTLTWIDPFEERKNPAYAYDKMSERISPEIEDEEAIALWEDVMKRVYKDGKVLLQTADTVTQVLTRKVMEFLDDEKHLAEKFDGVRPKYRQIYMGAGISKSTWDRLLAGGNSNIARGTVFALAIGLRLNETQTIELLHAAGMSLNYEIDIDVAIMYFIKRGIYDIKRIKRVLSNFSDVSNGLDRFYFQPPKTIE